jgi:hypothetical protein
MGAPVRLGGRAFEIIAELVRAEGELVSKNDLTERVWRGVFVAESALRVHIAAIRKALGPIATCWGRRSARLSAARNVENPACRCAGPTGRARAVAVDWQRLDRMTPARSRWLLPATLTVFP